MILSGILSGMFISHRNLNHIYFLEEYISLLSNFKTEIKYTQQPIVNILKNYEKEKYLFPLIQNCICLMQKTDFKTSWEKSFSGLYKIYGVTQREEYIIKIFASKVGTSDIQSQVNYFDYNISLIKPYLEKLLENKSKNQKLPIILGICASLIISIVLV